jgi:hypothetical protein
VAATEVEVVFAVTVEVAVEVEEAILEVEEEEMADFVEIEVVAAFEATEAEVAVVEGVVRLVAQ